MNERKDNSKLHALLHCVTPPTARQEKGILAFLRKKYGSCELEIVNDPSIKGGFVLYAGADVYDWSVKGRVQQLRRSLELGDTDASGIIPLLKEKIASFSLERNAEERGTVVSVGDGIATLTGLDNAEYGEIILFDSGVKGMVQDLRKNEVGCILFDAEGDVGQGSTAVRTGKTAGMPVGDAFLGRVVDALGTPIDGLGEISSTGYNPVETPAPGILDRSPVDKPLETGIIAIDSMFPIGRGQRELIIGDRQTGKTSIAVDTIINQKGKKVICVYVAIGQKASSVARIAETLRRAGSLGYTCIVAATASDSAPLQYIAPYAGCALAEYFMKNGNDVLIVYDDLSKHAVAYRALSLLLGRSPGREAYPGDVFYLHSRLLERSARLSAEKGGGSLTALPIVETQAGDVSAYIPTNIISITDGQIFLESNLFFSGQRPAVNVGLSVSRVGGAAQYAALRKAAGTLRIDLAQYREMEIFTQFSGDLDDATKSQLIYGQGLMRLLRQPVHTPMSLSDQVITLVAATDRAFSNVPLADVKTVQSELLAFFAEKHGDIVNEINNGKAMDDALRARISEAVREFFAK